MSTEPVPNEPKKSVPLAAPTFPNQRIPPVLPPEPYSETDVGVLLTGKEAQINLIERVGENGQSCLLVRKQYVPRKATRKGELEELGVQRASTFRNDAQYREGRQFGNSRDRRAVSQMSRHGQRLLQARWTRHESMVLEALWDAGMNVPFPVSCTETELTMQFIGAANGAAPQLAKARLNPADLVRALTQVEAGLGAMVRTGWVHGDLSAFNLLWWEDEIWFIDFPQALDLAANPQGLNFLHRDVLNIATWFNRRGVEVDGELLFSSLLGEVTTF